MENRFKYLIICTGLLSCLSSAVLNAQILSDTTSLKLVRKGIECIYNMEYNNADQIYEKINKMYPENPVTVMLHGLISYWKNYPLLPASSGRTTFEHDMRRCIELSEKNNKSHEEAENLLANLSAMGLLATFYADNGLSGDVFPLAKSTYKYTRRAFGFTSVFPDFYFFTGFYNYYREVYPKVHPLYRPLAILFPKGDRSAGLEQIQNAATNSILLKAEAYSLLSYIFMSYENNYQQAFYYSKHLHELYPANLEYLGEYIKNLLLMKMYDEAESLMVSPDVTNSSNPYFQAQLSVFNGILKEKKYQDYKQSQEFYLKGAKEMSLFGKYGDEFAAYAYFGLSRISEVHGDKVNKKMYRKRANDLAELKKVTFDE